MYVQLIIDVNEPASQAVGWPRSYGLSFIALNREYSQSVRDC